MSAEDDDDLNRKLAQTTPGDALSWELRRIKEEAAKGVVSRRSLRGLVEENGIEIRAARDAGASWDLIRAPIERTLGRPVSQRTLATYMADLAPRKGARLATNSKAVADVEAPNGPPQTMLAFRAFDDRVLVRSRPGPVPTKETTLPAQSAANPGAVVKTQVAAPAEGDPLSGRGANNPYNPFKGRR